MKEFKNYINEAEIIPIYEFIVTPIIVTLCAAAASHFAIKAGKKVKKFANNFWDWACGKQNINMSMSASESYYNDEYDLLNEAEVKVNKDEISPMQITTTKILERLIEISNPKDGKSGLYVFDNLFKEDPKLKDINKKPYYPNYVMFMDHGSKSRPDERPRFYGMLGFSQKYWSIEAKNAKDDKIKDFAKKHKAYMNIFAVQTNPTYAKQGLFDIYIENMKKAVKETKMEGLTIKCDNDDLAKVYSKYGFEKDDNIDDYMVMTLFKKEK